MTSEARSAGPPRAIEKRRHARNACGVPAPRWPAGDRPIAFGLAFVFVAATAVALAGCSKAPKPKVEVPAAEAGTARPAGKNGNVSSSGTGATGGTATNGSGSTKKPATAAKPAPPPAPATPDVGGVQTGSSTSSPAVVPQITVAEQERLERETKAAIEQAQKELDAVDAAKLDADRNRKYLIAKDFLVQAGSARTRKEYERAQALAVKAKLLAEEIATH